MSDASPAQIPPADELFALREQIRTLEAREAELRALLVADKSARTGNHFVAEVVEAQTAYTDIKELRAMHPALVEEYTFPKTVIRVVLKAISADGEITSIKRRRNETV